MGAETRGRSAGKERFPVERYSRVGWSELLGGNRSSEIIQSNKSFPKCHKYKVAGDKGKGEKSLGRKSEEEEWIGGI